ncbi:MAG: SRPBCC family protein [Candidatus Obscuribacterales bacterium]|nr:SRPBCC family protein [Candidatus Obscuribacterales bacterium]
MKIDLGLRFSKRFFIATTLLSLISSTYSLPVSSHNAAAISIPAGASDSLSAMFNKHFLLNHDSKKFARIVTVTDVKASPQTVLELLSDFPRFPEFMKRVKTVSVTRQEGNLFFTESYLKPQMFVSQTCNHTITQLHHKPNTIEWVLIDGNFPSASGRWEVEPTESGKSCKVTYTVAIDPGPIPNNIAALGLKIVQKELVAGMRTRAEQLARQSTLSKHQDDSNNHSLATSHPI